MSGAHRDDRLNSLVKTLHDILMKPKDSLQGGIALLMCMFFVAF